MTAKQLFILFFTVLCLTSCKEEGEVKLELKNKEVYFTETIDTLPYQYQNDAIRGNGQNIITYTFTNTTDKKLLFVFDQHEVWPSLGISPTTEHYGYVTFTIRDPKQTLRRFSGSLITWAASGEFSNCALYNLKQKEILYNKLGYNTNYLFDLDNFLNNATVIYPGEERTFKAIVNLPLVQEIDRSSHKPPVTYQGLKENDTFEFFYFCKAKRLKGVLPKYILDELKKNQIEIFDGKLVADTVKLKKR